MGYTLGLDIGQNSIGFAMVDIDKEKILCANAHLFGVEIDRTKQTLNSKVRRPRRGQRKTVNRKKDRLSRLMNILGYDLEKRKAIFNEKGNKRTSVWKLRDKALSKELTDDEFFRVLYYFAKHRCFQSNSKKNKLEKGVINEALDNFDKRILEKAETTGQILYEDLLKNPNDENDKNVEGYELSRIRNTTDVYTNFVRRDHLREELKQICNIQKKYQHPFSSIDIYKWFEEEKNPFWQRPIEIKEDTIGNCSVICNIEIANKLGLKVIPKRAPRQSPSSILFVFWTELNNIKIQDAFGQYRSVNNQPYAGLTLQERKDVFEYALGKKELTYSQIRNKIKLDKSYFFNKVKYDVEKKGKIKELVSNEEMQKKAEEMQKKAEEKTFCDLSGIFYIQKYFSNILIDVRDNKDLSFYDDIARIVTYYDDDLSIRQQLQKYNNINEDQIASILQLAEYKEFKGTLGLSLEACRILLNDISKGTTFYQAKKNNTNLDYYQKELQKLPPFEKTKNPVVDHALAECRKVINAILDKYRNDYGMPEAIRLEFSRELSKTEKETEEINKQNAENETKRKKAKEFIEDVVLKNCMRKTATEGEILKAQLYREQNGHCAYSLKPISCAYLQDGENRLQIEHIYPRSLVGDNSYMNKVLVFTEANQNKRNDIPYEFFQRTYGSGFDEHWNQFTSFVQKLPFPKRKRLLSQSLNIEGWQNRSMNDTSYICRRFRNHLLENLSPENSKNKIFIESRKGGLTHFLRKQWQFERKDRDVNDRHHILDAIILACSSISMVQQVFSWDEFHKKDQPIPKPWNNFTEDALRIVDDPERLISRRAKRTVTGEAHSANPLGLREDDKVLIKRISILELNQKNISSIYQSGNDERNENLRNILEQRLIENDWDSAKAFASNNPIYLTKKGEVVKDRLTAQIKHVRIVENNKSGRKLKDGFVDNGSQARVDVFSKTDKKGKTKFYLCPVYTWQILAEKKSPKAKSGELKNMISPHLPNTLISSGKDGWLQIDDTYQFMFSLYKNDFVQIVDKDGLVKEGYYLTTDIDTGRIEICNHDSKVTKSRISVQNLNCFKKLVINYFGKSFEVKKEKRLGVAHSDDSESSSSVPEQRTGAVAE